MISSWFATRSPPRSSGRTFTGRESASTTGTGRLAVMRVMPQPSSAPTPTMAARPPATMTMRADEPSPAAPRTR